MDTRGETLDELLKMRDMPTGLLIRQNKVGKTHAGTMGGSLPSVIIFRLKDMQAANVSRHLFSVIRQQSDALYQGAICSVTEQKVRVRHLPVEKPGQGAAE